MSLCSLSTLRVSSACWLGRQKVATQGQDCWLGGVQRLSHRSVKLAEHTLWTAARAWLLCSPGVAQSPGQPLKLNWEPAPDPHSDWDAQDRMSCRVPALPASRPNRNPSGEEVAACLPPPFPRFPFWASSLRGAPTERPYLQWESVLSSRSYSPSSPLLENAIELLLPAGLGSCYLPSSRFQRSSRTAFIRGGEAMGYNKVAHSLHQERATRLHFKSVIDENSFSV